MAHPRHGASQQFHHLVLDEVQPRLINCNLRSTILLILKYSGFKYRVPAWTGPSCCWLRSGKTTTRGRRTSAGARSPPDWVFIMITDHNHNDHPDRISRLEKNGVHLPLAGVEVPLGDHRHLRLHLWQCHHCHHRHHHHIWKYCRGHLFYAVLREINRLTVYLLPMKLSLIGM